MRKKFLPFLLIAIMSGAALGLMAENGILAGWQHRFSDALYGGAKPLDNIVIVAVDDKSLQEIGRWPWNRTNYVALLKQLNGSRIVAFDISFFEPSIFSEDEALGRAMRSAGNVIIPKEAVKFGNGRTGGIEWLNPIPELANITAGVVNIFTDSDGISRSIPVKIGGEQSLAFVIAEKFIGKPSGFDEARMLVNFAGRPFSFKMLSFADVINEKVPAGLFTGKIVLVGATAPDLHDDYLVPTSWGRRMSGIEIHANALQTILMRRFLHYQQMSSVWVVIFLLSLVTALLFWRVSGTKAVIGSAVLFIGLFAAAMLLYSKGVIVNLVHQPLAIIVTGVLCTGYIARAESRHKKHILSVFGRYVSKDVVDHLLKSEKSLELGGQEREISVLFVDIRGFTALSEKLSPSQVIDLLNHYFSKMTDIVFRNNGTLDKFIGDSIMAVFNSPENDPDHAYHAVKTAVEMQEACKKQAKGAQKINIGIGVNTGRAVVGNMGSTQRQEFTALGDTVNTASRLCGEAEGGQIVIGEKTYEQCKNKIIAKKLPPMKVKGKQKALTVYEVKGLKK
ncbi:MAG: adenylate/guanylate cyclase domain-containing protein [Candidatus Woesearchaeota archaeon]